MGMAALLILIANVVAWLIFFAGVFIAIFRHARRRGRIIMGAGATLVVLLIVTLIVVPLALRNITVPAGPSPSDATLVATSLESNGHTSISGLSGHDGSARWQRPLDMFLVGGIVDNGMVYATGNSQADGTGPTVAALRLSDGAPQWRLALPGLRITSSNMSVANGLLLTVVTTNYAPPTTQVVAVSLSTHLLVWRADVPNLAIYPRYSTLATGGGLLFLGSYDGIVRALRLSDGSLAWSMRITPEPGNSGLSSAMTVGVATRGALLIVYDSTGEVVSLRQSDGATLWGRQVGLQPYSDERVSLTGEGLYACGDVATTRIYELLSLDPTTGASRWSRPAACGSSAPIESGAYLYTLDSATLTVVRVSDGTLVWHSAPEESDLGYTNLQSDGAVVFAATTITAPRSLNLCADWWTRGIIFCHSTQYVAAFNGTTGARYWRTSDAYTGLLGVA